MVRAINTNLNVLQKNKAVSGLKKYTGFNYTSIKNIPQQDIVELSSKQSRIAKLRQSNSKKNDFSTRALKMNAVAENLYNTNFENVELLNHLSEQQRKIVTKTINYEVMNTHEFAMFATGNKPSYIFGTDDIVAIKNILCLKSDNIDIVTRRINGGYNAIMINKGQVKEIIAQNKELFTARMGLNKNTTVDAIYEQLISQNSPLKVEEKYSDIIGLVLGFPKKNSILYRLDQFLQKTRQMSAPNEISDYDIPLLKQKLKEALYSKNSPYEKMSDGFKKDIIKAIDNINEVKHSSVELGKTSGYTFKIFVDEPEEFARIQRSLDNYSSL